MNPAHAARSGLPDTRGFAHPVRNVAALGIEPGMIVADFGSGSGAYALAIAEALQGSGHIYAIDVQKDLLRRTLNDAAKRGLKIDIICADLEKPNASKLADKMCDVVLISNLLFQVEDKKILFREARRILRPRGRLVVIDWQESFGGMGPIKGHVVNRQAALALVQQSGFKLFNEFPAGAHHYGLIFETVTVG